MIVQPDGSIYHLNENGDYHREDGPAIIYSWGEKNWFINGMLHREDGPAIERPNGSKEWWINNKRHRDDGPAIETNHGEDHGKEYWVNGIRHREDGPAIERAYVKEYWLNGELHREDGPAIIRKDGRKRYFLNGKEYHIKEYKIYSNYEWQKLVRKILLLG
jgi:hypothetical protein